MSLLDRFKRFFSSDSPEASTWTNPLWWTGGGDSVAGVAVGPETALKISAVYACVGLLSETIASLPIVLYRYIENFEGRERARNHPLYTVLHDQPNEYQTAVEFVQMMQAHALMRGSGYAEIKAGPRGFADQLIPLHPDNVTKERTVNGRIRYRVRDDSGYERVLNAESVFEVGGLSLDGWNTVSVIAYARDSFGLSLAAERYGSKFFRNDSRPGGVLQTDAKLSKDAALRIKNDWEAMHTYGNNHRVAVLEQGLTWQTIGIPPDQAQFLETREFQAEDVCRWFRVPPHMVGLTSKATSWGSGIEEMNIGFLTYTLRPWLSRWTQAIRRDLILAPDTYFADFIVEHLLKGDIESRYSAYATGRQWGWLSVNEIRQYENLNPVPNGDVYLQPMNMSPAGTPPAGQGSRARAEHYRLLAEEAAGRVVRKEIMAMNRAAEKHPERDQLWKDAVALFYNSHAPFVAQTMRIGLMQAMAYSDDNCQELMVKGPETMDDWITRRVEYLVEMAIGADDER